VDLPCQDGLRWFDDEGFVGSGGTLYLKLTPPPQCLTALITGLGGDPAREQRARDANGAARRPSLPFLPSTVDWKFPPGHDYGEYRLPSRGREDLQLFLDHSTTPVTGYLVAHHR
jgi:hypothetical protein